MQLRLQVLLLAACLAGCATTPVSDVNQFAARSASNSFELRHRKFQNDGLVLAVAHDQQRDVASCGAHALASIINYWRPGAVTGDALYVSTPPTQPRLGYSLAELQDLAQRQGLQTSAVRLGKDDIQRELESGRPVLVPVLVPGVFVTGRNLPGHDAPVVGLADNFILNRAGQISELTRMGLVSHYVVVVGYDARGFAIVEPVQGYRTISFDRLERYRRPFGNAALVFSAATPSRPQQAAQN